MSDGPLSQEEIDALLQGAGSVLKSEKKTEVSAVSENEPEEKGDFDEFPLTDNDTFEEPSGMKNCSKTEAPQEAASRLIHIRSEQLYTGKLTVRESFSNKLISYLNGNGKKALKSKYLSTFYNDILDPDEKKFISGDDYGDEYDGSVMKGILKRIRNSITGVNKLVPDVSCGYELNLEKFRFPVTVRVEAGTVVYNEIIRGEDQVPVSDISGRKALLVIGDMEIGSGKISAKDGKVAFIELTDTVMNSRSGALPLTDLLHEYRFNISVEVGRKSIHPLEAEEIYNGTALVFDKYAGEHLDVILEDYDLVIAKGEACILGEVTAVRITEMVNINLPGVLNGEYEKKRDIGPEAIVPVRFVYGRRKMTIKEVIGLGEGSVLELDRIFLVPAELMFGDEPATRAELIVVDGKLGARVPVARLKNLYGNKPVKSVLESSCEREDVSVGETTGQDYTSGMDGADKPFSFFNENNIEHTLSVLENEHPQTIALVLSYLEAKHCAMILSYLPPEVRIAVTRRIACMRGVSVTVIEDLEKVLRKKLSRISSDRYLYSGGLDHTIEIIKNTDHGMEKSLIEGLEETDPQTAAEIKKWNVFI